MEQYSGELSEEMQKYNLWEQDYYYSQGQGLISEAASTDFINACGGKHIWVDNPPNEDVARNVSSPETANPGKQKRRRSKGGAAAAQSTTFLNASISNFRALVQQHTGCHNANSSPKGPITLCFSNSTSAPSTHGDSRILNHNQYYCS